VCDIGCYGDFSSIMVVVFCLTDGSLNSTLLYHQTSNVVNLKLLFFAPGVIKRLANDVACSHIVERLIGTLPST